jgi:hypothetical protein
MIMASRKVFHGFTCAWSIPFGPGFHLLNRGSALPKSQALGIQLAYLIKQEIRFKGGVFSLVFNLVKVLLKFPDGSLQRF